MKYFTALPLVAGLAFAQEMMVMSLAPQASSGPMTHTVVVGGLKPVETGMAAVLGYVPESITAKVGDMVTFVFMQKNHTATQSTFAEPCKKKEGGMDSGFMPNPDGKAGVTWNMTVETEEALWFYCKQQNGIHCGKGMVFSINAATTGDKTMADFKNLAIGKNGTSLAKSPIQNVDPAAAAAVASPVTVLAGGAAATGTGTGAAAGAVATVIAGQGTDGQGQSCTCSCLCGMNSFPAQAAINNFGGFPGMLS
jgi:plastocyanin